MRGGNENREEDVREIERDNTRCSDGSQGQGQGQKRGDGNGEDSGSGNENGERGGGGGREESSEIRHIMIKANYIMIEEEYYRTSTTWERGGDAYQQQTPSVARPHARASMSLHKGDQIRSNPRDKGREAESRKKE